MLFVFFYWDGLHYCYDTSLCHSLVLQQVYSAIAAVACPE